MPLAKDIADRTLASPQGEGAYAVCEALLDAGYEAWWVGGAVRDMLLGEVPLDIDIATSATPEQVQAVFPDADLSAAALGAALAFSASAIGQRVQLQRWGTRPNVYVLAVAHSGAGKERPQSACKMMARSAGLFSDMIGVEEVASDTGIVNAVMRAPRLPGRLSTVTS